MADVTPNSSPKSKWEVTRDALSAAIDSFPNNTAVGLLLYPNQPTVPNASTTPLPTDNCVNVAAAVSPQALGAAGSAQRVAIANSLAMATNQGGRPTEDAYAYAVNAEVIPAMNNLGYYHADHRTSHGWLTHNCRRLRRRRTKRATRRSSTHYPGHLRRLDESLNKDLVIGLPSS